MPLDENRVRRNKISTRFAARLAQLGSDERIRAIVLFDTDAFRSSSGRRQSQEERKAAVEATRNAAKQALCEVDDILKWYDGERLADEPDAFGSVPVIATAAGIAALARADSVKLIMEDQDISLVW
jgi:hypothetical protein